MDDHSIRTWVKGAYPKASQTEQLNYEQFWNNVSRTTAKLLIAQHMRAQSSLTENEVKDNVEVSIKEKL